MPQYVDDEIYHVFNRGAHRFPIFFDSENYRYCLRLVEKYARRYSVSRLAHCLMPNHYHFVLRQDKAGSISLFLQTVFNAYVQAVNKHTGHKGTLFERCAQGLLIDSDDYAMQVIRYIHLNPVAAGLVTAPDEWEFSDYGTWIIKETTEHPSHGFRSRFFLEGNTYASFVENMRYLLASKSVEFPDYRFSR